jgi:hypothetical protein
VRELALPGPGSDARLAAQAARIFSRPLDRARPLWELYVIHGLTAGLVAVLTKIHHAVIDGMSGAEVMGLLLDMTPRSPAASCAPRRFAFGRLPLDAVKAVTASRSTTSSAASARARCGAG